MKVTFAGIISEDVDLLGGGYSSTHYSFFESSEALQKWLLFKILSGGRPCSWRRSGLGPVSLFMVVKVFRKLIQMSVLTHLLCFPIPLCLIQQRLATLQPRHLSPVITQKPWLGNNSRHLIGTRWTSNLCVKPEYVFYPGVFLCIWSVKQPLGLCHLWVKNSIIQVSDSLLFFIYLVPSYPVLHLSANFFFSKTQATTFLANASL